MKAWITRIGCAAVVFTTALGAQDIQVPPAADAAAKTIDAGVIDAHVRFLSDDLLEGRAPASRGDQLARLYIAEQLRGMGYEPGAANGSYQQPFDIVGITTEAPKTWSFATKGSTTDLKWWDEYIVTSGVQEPSASVRDAELVFVGYGIEAPEYKWNDFKGQDLKGKILVMMNNDPDWDPKLFEGNKRLYYGRWTYKYESAARQGAAGAIIIHTTPSAGYNFGVVQSSWTGEQFELPPSGLPTVQLKGWFTEDATRKLLAAAGHDLDKLVASAKQPSFKPVPLGIRTSLAVTAKISKVQTANVLGLLPGSDPALKDEVVVFSAHHDHLGVGEPDASGDRIYNGARDNALGVAQLLAMAKAYAEMPQRPRRSLLFAFVAAEEQGLLGSKYYAEHPTFHPGKIAANINYDGGNIWGRTTDLTLIGKGKSSLDAIAEGLAKRQGRVLKADQFADKGFFYRSDQFNFAKIGVPALYFDEGTEFRDRPADWGKTQLAAWEAKSYHQPSDEVDETWNLEGTLEDAQLGVIAGWIVAQADEMPRWNPGDEFEAARKKAIAEANAEKGTAVEAKGQ